MLVFKTCVIDESAIEQERKREVVLAEQPCQALTKS